MVPYFGRHSCKMFIKGKPIRFGYKEWILCSSSGYPFNIDIYCGKKDDDDMNVPLGTRVVLSALKCIDVPTNHVIFMDNFFHVTRFAARAERTWIPSNRNREGGPAQEMPTSGFEGTSPSKQRDF